VETDIFLTMVDYATQYPEATALKSIEAETVVEALLTVFTRVGIPEEILSDQGSQFLSSVIKDVSRLLSMNQLVTTPYHPMWTKEKSWWRDLMVL